MRARRFFSLSLSLKQHTRSLLLLKEEEEEEEETLLKTCLFIRVYNWGIIGRAKKARTTRRDDIDVFLSDAGKERSIIIIP